MLKKQPIILLILLFPFLGIAQQTVSTTAANGGIDVVIAGRPSGHRSDDRTERGSDPCDGRHQR